MFDYYTNISLQYKQLELTIKGIHKNKEHEGKKLGNGYFDHWQLGIIHQIKNPIENLFSQSTVRE
jgi:hypothetical protein